MNTRDLLFLAQVFRAAADTQKAIPPPEGFQASADRLARAGWIIHDGYGCYSISHEARTGPGLLELLERGPSS